MLAYCTDTLGAHHGAELLAAFSAAADRGVKIRLLNDAKATVPPQLLNHANIASAFWDPRDFYSSGIMHQKIWVIDSKHIYLGSANMDWKSLTQVKELGIAVHNSTAVGGDVQNLFNVWWKFANTASSKVEYFDVELQSRMAKPCWAVEFEGISVHCPNPLLIAATVGGVRNAGNQVSTSKAVARLSSDGAMYCARAVRARAAYISPPC